MNFKRVKISTTVPVKDADRLRKALGEAGAGKMGAYSFCSFSVTGTGRFKPAEGAHPYIGEVNKLEAVEEEQVEVVCGRNVAKQVITALRAAHPYEEVIVEIIPLLEEEML